MSALILHFTSMSEAPNRIRELRMAHRPKRLSQDALGQMIGTSKMTISDLERGKMRLDTEYMRRISQALGVQPADLLSHADNPDALSQEDRKWVARRRAMTPEQREQLDKLADVVAPYSPAEEPEERLTPRKSA